MSTDINPLGPDHYKAMRDIRAANDTVRPYLQKLAQLMPDMQATLDQWDAAHQFCVGCMEHFPEGINE
jgi:hypothetical protein